MAGRVYQSKLPLVRQPLFIGGVLLLSFALVFAGYLLVRFKAGSQPRSSSTLNAPIAGPWMGGSRGAKLAIVNGVLYATAPTANLKYAVYALRDGKMLWRVDVDAGWAEAPVVLNDRVYVTLGNTLEALQASDGKILWHYTNPGLSPPVVTDEAVYVDTDNGIVALQASDGTQRWAYAATDPAWIFPPADGSLYVTLHRTGTILALQTSDGKLRWQNQTRTNLSKAMVNSGVVYAASWDGKLTALRASDGQRLWSQIVESDIHMAAAWGAIQIVNGVLYVAMTDIVHPGDTGSGSGGFPLALGTSMSDTLWPLHKEGIAYIFALRASDGKQIWRTIIDNGKNYIGSWLTVYDNVVYASAVSVATATGFISALNASDGSMRWQVKTERALASAVVVGDVMYVSGISSYADEAEPGAVFALSTLDGTQRWSLPTTTGVFNPPLVIGSLVSVGDSGGTIYVCQAATGKLQWQHQAETGQ